MTKVAQRWLAWLYITFGFASIILLCLQIVWAATWSWLSSSPSSACIAGNDYKKSFNASNFPPNSLSCNIITTIIFIPILAIALFTLPLHAMTEKNLPISMQPNFSSESLKVEDQTQESGFKVLHGFLKSSLRWFSSQLSQLTFLRRR